MDSGKLGGNVRYWLNGDAERDHIFLVLDLGDVGVDGAESEIVGLIDHCVIVGNMTTTSKLAFHRWPSFATGVDPITVKPDSKYSALFFVGYRAQERELGLLFCPVSNSFLETILLIQMRILPLPLLLLLLPSLSLTQSYETWKPNVNTGGGPVRKPMAGKEKHHDMREAGERRDDEGELCWG